VISVTILFVAHQIHNIICWKDRSIIKWNITREVIVRSR